MSQRRPCVRGVAVMSLVLLAGCSRSEPKPASTLTEAQRDTAIARSQIPGAAAVGRALAVGGREAAHSAQVDSLPPH